MKEVILPRNCIKYTHSKEELNLPAVLIKQHFIFFLNAFLRSSIFNESENIVTSIVKQAIYRYNVQTYSKIIHFILSN